MDQLYVAREGQWQGPYPRATAEGMRAAGQLQDSDQVWFEGSAGSMPLATALVIPASGVPRSRLPTVSFALGLASLPLYVAVYVISYYVGALSLAQDHVVTRAGGFTLVTGFVCNLLGLLLGTIAAATGHLRNWRTITGLLGNFLVLVLVATLLALAFHYFGDRM